MMAQPKSHFLEGKTILIAGAGMAGLAFATALTKQWDPSLKRPIVRIYERDTEETAEGRQGYSLSLAGYDSTGGMYALKQLGLLDTILPHVVSGLDASSSFKLWNPDWSQVLSVRFKPAEGLPSSTIRVARKNLRKVLLDAGGGSAEISWGTQCTAARQLENGKVAVTVSRGPDQISEEECDVLICADGSNSKLRSCLRPEDKLTYLGAVQLGGSATFDALPPETGKHWGVTHSGGHGLALFSAPVDDTSIVWSISKLEAEPRAPLDKGSREKKQAVLDECRALGQVFSEPFSSFVDNTDLDDVFCMPARDKQPFPHDDLGPIVFIGDSNHAVSPFAGYGASLAMKDGWDLAEQMCRAENLGEAMKAYDAISIPRAKKVLDTSHGRIRDMHLVGIRFYLWRLLATIGGFMLWLTGQT